MSREPSAVPGPQPDAIAAQTFTRARKGFEVDEVRAYLVSVSSQVREAQRVHADMARRLAELERRGADPRDLEVAEVSELLGEQTARVLDTARQGAAEMRSTAAAHVAQITAEADTEAAETRAAATEYDNTTRSGADDYAHTARHEAEAAAARIRAEATTAAEAMRSEASTVLADRTAEAEAAAAALRSEADTYASATRTAADGYAATTRSDADTYRTSQHDAGDAYRAEALAEGDRTLGAVASEAATARAAVAAEAAEGREAAEADAEAIRDAGRREGRAMVDEARDYRERVITDLADRRRTARSQLDQLASSRDALAVTLTDVASRIDASYRLITATVIDPRDLGDVAADRDAFADRALPEQLQDPSPEDETDPVDAGPVDPDDPVETAGDPEPGEPEPDEMAGDHADSGLDVIEESDLTGASDVHLAKDVEPRSDSVDAVADRNGGTAKPDDGDPADAVFAQLKAASHGDDEEDTTDTATDAVPAEELTSVEAVSAPVDPDPADPEPTHETAAGDEPLETETDVEPAPVDVEPEADPDADLLDRRDAATDAIERQLAKRLKRVLSDEQNEALDRLRRVRGEARSDQVLTSEEDHRERYRAAAVEDLSDAERAGAGFFGDAPTRPADVDDVADTFAADLVRALRGRLEAAFDDGGDEQEVGERIRACYREWKTQRIAEVARHSVQIAFGRGVAAYEAESSTRWVVDHGGEAAPDCDDNSLAGAVAPGEAYPTGDHHPPIHHGCRCLAVPVPAEP